MAFRRFTPETQQNGRAVNARPSLSVLGDTRDELQQGAARILVDPPHP